MLTPGKFYSLVIAIFLIIFLVEKAPSVKTTSYASCGACDFSCWLDFCKDNECPFHWPDFPPFCPTHTPSPTPTPTSGPEPTPTEVIPTNTPIPETPTPTSILPTNTPGPAGPTNTPGPRPEHNTCYYQCNWDYDCHSGQECQDVGGGRKICRNPHCPEESDCDCPGPTATPGPAGGTVLGEAVTPTPTPKYGEVLGLAYTSGIESLALHLGGVASNIGKIMVIAGCLLLL